MRPIRDRIRKQKHVPVSGKKKNIFKYLGDPIVGNVGYEKGYDDTGRKVTQKIMTKINKGDYGIVQKGSNRSPHMNRGRDTYFIRLKDGARCKLSNIKDVEDFGQFDVNKGELQRAVNEKAKTKNPSFKQFLSEMSEQDKEPRE